MFYSGFFLLVCVDTDDSKARVLGHTLGKDSLSAEVQRVADHNANVRHVDE